MRTALSVLVALTCVSYAHCIWPFGGAATKTEQVGECQFKKKDVGIIGGAVNTAGRLAGGLVGGIWGAVVPTSMNQGAIAAASGDENQDQSNSGLLTGATNVLGRGIAGTWGAVMPNSIRCGSIDAAKSTGNVGTNKKDKACDDFHWVDDNGNPCTPPKPTTAAPEE